MSIRRKTRKNVDAQDNTDDNVTPQENTELEFPPADLTSSPTTSVKHVVSPEPDHGVLSVPEPPVVVVPPAIPAFIPIPAHSVQPASYRSDKMSLDFKRATNTSAGARIWGALPNTSSSVGLGGREMLLVPTTRQPSVGRLV
jgi:hypothetical protein